MTTAPLKQRLLAREALLGTFLKTPHPHVVEVLATTPLDLLCIDAEHAPFDRKEIDACILAARAGGLPVFVRPSSTAPEGILNALDCGADGVLLPHVRSAEQAGDIARLCRYGSGGRGYAGSTRAARYGLTPMAEHLSRSNAQVIVIGQIEDAEAIDVIEEIATVAGLDALFVGRADLTVSLGCTQQDDPKVVAAIEQAVAACRNAGKPCGLFLARPEEAKVWTQKGASLFILASDHAFLRTGVAALKAATGL